MRRYYCELMKFSIQGIVITVRKAPVKAETVNNKPAATRQ